MGLQNRTEGEAGDFLGGHARVSYCEGMSYSKEIREIFRYKQAVYTIVRPGQEGKEHYCD
jgi:hypothetical protein